MTAADTKKQSAIESLQVSLDAVIEAYGEHHANAEIVRALILSMRLNMGCTSYEGAINVDDKKALAALNTEDMPAGTLALVVSGNELHKLHKGALRGHDCWIPYAMMRVT